MPRIEPMAAGCEAVMQPLCNAAPPKLVTDFAGATFLKRVSSAAEGMERKALICFSPLLFGLPFSWPVAAAASQLLSLAGPPRASRPKRPIAAERHFPINNIFVREIKENGSQWLFIRTDKLLFRPIPNFSMFRLIGLCLMNDHLQI